MTAENCDNKRKTKNMIQLSRNYSLPEREDQIIPIKVIAVGSAGSNALDRVVLDGMDKSDLIAANTDVQSLASSVAAVKVQLGRSLTRGLGTGGDPDLGFDTDRMADMVGPKAGIHQAFAVADMTISQSLRSIVNLIQRPGIMRIGFDDLLAALHGGGGRCLFGYGESDSDNRAHQALAQALKNPLMDRGRMLADASRVLVQVAGGPGMTLSEVEILMRELNKHISEHTQLLFGTAVDGRMGDRLSVTLISSLPADEAEVAPRKSKAHAPPPPPPEPVIEPVAEPQIVQFVQPEAPEPEPVMEAEPAVFQHDEIIPPEPSVEDVLPPPEAIAESQFAEAEMEPEIESAPRPTTPRIIPPKKKPLIAPKVEAENPKREKAAAAAKQEILQFEPITRGRFEKSEPTIVEGQDLDVPTFLRKNVRVK